MTHADLHYVGSITIDADLLEAEDVLPGEQLAVLDVTNGARRETYAIEGERGSGVLGINGAAAHLVDVGDAVILIAYQTMSDAEARAFRPRVVRVDAHNLVVATGADPTAPWSTEGLRPPYAASSRRNHSPSDLASRAA